MLLYLVLHMLSDVYRNCPADTKCVTPKKKKKVKKEIK